MTTQDFASVWDALEDDPIEAATMRLKSELMLALQQHIAAQAWNQKTAGELLGVTQPRISDLLRGKISVFGLEALIVLATKAGMQIEMQIKSAA